MSSPPDPVAHYCETDEGCITCGDVAVELEVVEVDAERGLALCRDEHGRSETVETALVEPVSVGDTLLVHAGTALATPRRNKGLNYSKERDRSTGGSRQ